ncbi:ribosome biogenesis GTPase YlqF [Thiomicrospira cyclica]|uniref:Ribosome biogenesis GTPase A n=1 Tax=Thiomicrospira cyclica (strain DSM 14477 / JCM 11371 / ALM1) TaxID=717773 RepID=F6DCY3_THICA|nr:ribosome biogenesis GTPase YlqF [Thiomicrospira cyclica]AEG31719.1 ribosome biogenesis GTP-binding protein YlqF [Thiomicrospira cyclica ALM1]
MINWFPGHMHKARKEIAEVMPRMDVVIEILDARLPFSSENPLTAGLRGEKPCIKLLNKVDLADPQRTQAWLDYFNNQAGVQALAISEKNSSTLAPIYQRIDKALAGKDIVIRGGRVMIMGIPNVGKSTLINAWVGKKMTKTGNEAGVTRSQQNIKIANNMTLTDTPGFLWPKLTPPEAGFRLAISGAIKETAYDYIDLGLFTAQFLLQDYPEALTERYGIDLTALADLAIEEQDEALLTHIAQKRGCMLRPGSVDWDKVCRLVVNEVRDGKLGALTYESPEQCQIEVARAQQADAEKARLKAEKDAERKARTRKNRR